MVPLGSFQNMNKCGNGLGARSCDRAGHAVFPTVELDTDLRTIDINIPHNDMVDPGRKTGGNYPDFSRIGIYFQTQRCL